jgi:hypothetical protein
MHTEPQLIGNIFLVYESSFTLSEHFYERVEPKMRKKVTNNFAIIRPVK